jgi:hypothetical protein
MRYRFYLDHNLAAIGGGALLAVLGLVRISPVVVWLIQAIGVVVFIMGVLLPILGIGAWIFLPRRRCF